MALLKLIDTPSFSVAARQGAAIYVKNFFKKWQTVRSLAILGVEDLIILISTNLGGCHHKRSREGTSQDNYCRFDAQGA